jgi:hypothetical protein
MPRFRYWLNLSTLDSQIPFSSTYAFTFTLTFTSSQLHLVSLSDLRHQPLNQPTPSARKCPSTAKRLRGHAVHHLSGVCLLVSQYSSSFIFAATHKLEILDLHPKHSHHHCRQIALVSRPKSTGGPHSRKISPSGSTTFWRGLTPSC